MRNIQKTSSNEKALLLVDLEGIIGVNDIYQDSRNYKLLERQLIISIYVLFIKHINDISLCFIHNNNYEFVRKLCDRLGHVSIIAGVNDLYSQVSNFSIAFMLGFHGMSNNGDKFDHSFRHDITKIFFGDLVIGEVGVFYRWLEMKGVNVIFVSGRGEFFNEICNAETYIHKVKNGGVVCEILRYLQKLYKCIGLYESSCARIGNWINKPIKIQLDNPDKCTIVDKNVPAASVDGDLVCFESLDVFIRELLNICRELKLASAIVMKRNKQLALIARKNIPQFSSVTLYKISNIPLHLITKSNWEKIFLILGINHEIT